MAKVVNNIQTKSTPAVQSSCYPSDYNKNDPMSGFNSWTEHIRSELTKSTCNPTIVILISFNPDHCCKVLEAKCALIEGKIMDNLVLMANLIINNKK